MATEGNGTFTEFTSGGQITFLNINYTSAKQTYALTNLIVDNLSTLPDARGALTDSDGDGLPDEVEDELRLCAYELGGIHCNLGGGQFRNPLDSDGDGYGDAFEYRFSASGFDPTGMADRSGRCRELDDSDGDGLRDCEEAFVGSDPRLHDSDGDRIPDGVELRHGLDPARREDALADHDADGVLNADEVLAHTTPRAKEPTDSPPPKYRYRVTWLGETPEGRNCYDFSVDDVRLATTRAVSPENRGTNLVRIHFLEGPPDDPRDFGAIRVACARARFIAPDLKVPASGRMILTEQDFFDPSDPELRCAEPRMGL
jgi:hypothetical protein